MDEEAWDDDEGFEEVKQGDEPVWEVPVTYDKNDPDRIFCPRCTHIWKTWEDKQRRVAEQPDDTKEPFADEFLSSISHDSI